MANAKLGVAGLCLLLHTLAGAQQATQFASLDGTVLNAWHIAPTAPAAQDAAQRPVVVALHGCGGLYASSGARKGQLNARHQAMADMLAGEGYHVVFPDSFTPRGASSICAQKIGSRKITQTQRRADALATLAWVRSQPWADPARVAVLGWSHGGSAVLAATDGQHAQVQAASVAQQQLFPNAGGGFKTAVAFYPGCSDAQREGYRPNTGLAFFLGADDDWTPPAPCIALAQHLQAKAAESKHPVELHVYPGAVHDFDTPLPGVRERADVPSRLHPGQGVKAGQNPAARQASWARVKELLQAAFR